MNNELYKRLIVLLIIFSSGISVCNAQTGTFTNPGREFSVMPFWFWNDTLSDREIIRQIADFDDHGVYGFVIHPRIGLPDDVSWLSDKMIHFMRTAIEEAAKRKMFVILYDEGMYPSGSSSGQVVARNPDHAAKGLAKIDLKKDEEPVIPEGAVLVTINRRKDGSRVAIIEKPSGGVIRGLHYIGEGSVRMREETPPAGDILNPDAVNSFVQLVYEKFYNEFGNYFGNTIIGIFTDEPSPLGRGGARGIVPGNKKLIPKINRHLGYDISPFLCDLWYKDSPEAAKHSADYNRALNLCLEDIYYKRLSDWCSDHKIALMGHPAGSMDIGTERYFQIPGQDLVWRYVEPGEKALEGQHSTMAKCASSAMIHLGLRRNSNELYGAYGHNLTWEEVLWLANWCFVRGQNLLIPHAFYYSVRGPRLDERPPDVGPNSKWWEKFRGFADAASRISWINTDSKPVCQVAVLADPTDLPYRSARTLYENQIDFNYLDVRHLYTDIKVEKNGFSLKGMLYKVLLVDSSAYVDERAAEVIKSLSRGTKIIYTGKAATGGNIPGIVRVTGNQALIDEIRKSTDSDVILATPDDGIRYRHVIKDGTHYYLFFNEKNRIAGPEIKLPPLKGRTEWVDQYTGAVIKTLKSPSGIGKVDFRPYEMKILRIAKK